MTVRIWTALRSLRVAAAAIALAAPLSAATLGAGEARAQSAPFGSHAQAYDGKTLKPKGKQGKIDKQTAAFYAKWKAAYLKPGCKAGHQIVKADTFTGATVVSEGQGYGMLILAMMAGEEPQARKLFDGLYRYYLDHPSKVDGDLMAWAQDDKCNDIFGGDSATDGDLDAAYALLIAHRQWGSSGALNYLAGAKRVMKALLRSNVATKSRLTTLGDWVTTVDDSSKYKFASRSSDWMPGHFRAFADQGSTKWSGVLKASQNVADRLQSVYAPATGLLPDFAVNTNKKAKPAPPNFLENVSDGRYGYNACRDPWRFGIDAAISGDAKSAKVARKISEWARRKTSGDPAALRDGYELNGAEVVEYQTMAFVAPFAVAATVDPKGQKWLDALWAAMVERELEGYYPDSIRLLSMLAVSRNWLTP